MTALLVLDMPWAGELLEPLIAELGSCAAAALVPVDGSRYVAALPVRVSCVPTWLSRAAGGTPFSSVCFPGSFASPGPRQGQQVTLAALSTRAGRA